MADQKLNCGVIGCGRMGKRRIKSIMESKYGNLVEVVDTDEKFAKDVGTQYKVPYFASYDRIIKNPSIDLVVVCVPNVYHIKLVTSALENDKHVFCEKPLARNSEEAEEMVLTSVKSGKTLKTGSNLRYFPNVIKAKQLMDENRIGTPLFLRAWIGHNGWNLPKHWFSQVEVSGGGTFLDNGVHVFDLARWFMGEFVECTGMIDNAHWDLKKMEDNAIGIFRSKEGRLATIHSSWTDWEGYAYIEIYGSDGFIRLDSRGSNCTALVGDIKGQTELFDYSNHPPSSYKDEMESYLSALIYGKVVAPTGYDGLRAVRMAQGVYESALENKTISIYTEHDKEIEDLINKST